MRPIDSVFPVCRNIDEVPRPHFQWLVVVLESKSGCSFEQDNEFSFLLVVPKALRRGVAVRNNPFDANVV